MNAGARVGILGGTLDPIHVGHLDTALAAREALGLERVVMIPSRLPPHRAHQPVASPFHRFAMAALAVNGVEGLSVSDIELTTPGPSYTADTLGRIADALALRPSQIFFITGADAFAEIETWSRFPEVLDLANFVAVSRPGVPVGELRQRLPALKDRMRLPLRRADAAPETTATSIFLVDAPTTDASSTEIRRRLGAALPLHGLVPTAIEHHIQQHGLYVQQPHTAFRADHLHGEN
ncbi:MAG: nicotinate-nucleotide adenylyltransferase [Vicinamibacterales bacterium]